MEERLSYVQAACEESLDFDLCDCRFGNYWAVCLGVLGFGREGDGEVLRERGDETGVEMGFGIGVKVDAYLT